tara:strand:- start:5135 stop:6220 length:1086 start_codon:yes stop_codon:yes gene_type:complete
MQLTNRFVYNKDEWNQILLQLCGNQILQSWEWGEFKSCYDWTPQRIIWCDGGDCKAAAQILTRNRTFLGINFKIMYVPRGPILDWNDNHLIEIVLNDLRDLAIYEDAVFVKVDPYVTVGRSIYSYDQVDLDSIGHIVTQQLEQNGWQKSNQQIQFRNTMILDLDIDTNDLLLSFSQKTRYNIRLATRKGLVVRNGTIKELDSLYDLYKLTSNRNGFAIRSRSYYVDLWKSLIQSGMAQSLIVEFDGELVGAVVLSIFGGCATYMYGMSSGSHTEKMPNYLLQWEAILKAIELECNLYDFWGVPDLFVEDDPLWGVWRFKSGFRGEVIYTTGAWDFVYKWLLYWLYTNIVPRIFSYIRMRNS